MNMTIVIIVILFVCDDVWMRHFARGKLGIAGDDSLQKELGYTGVKPR